MDRRGYNTLEGVNNMIKKTGIWIAVTQLLIILSSFIIYKRIGLLSYTNVSFVFGAALILIALAGYVAKGRFFDIVFYSFQHFFSKMNDQTRRPLSELVPQHYHSPFLTGIITILLMLITLVLYQAA